MQKIQLNHLKSGERKGVEKLLKQYEKLIYIEGDTLTNMKTVVHEIKTTTSQQINSRIYRLPHKHEEEAVKQIRKLERKGIIRKSRSKYSSPIMIVAQGGNTLKNL